MHAAVNGVRLFFDVEAANWRPTERTLAVIRGFIMRPK